MPRLRVRLRHCFWSTNDQITHAWHRTSTAFRRHLPSSSPCRRAIDCRHRSSTPPEPSAGCLHQSCESRHSSKTRSVVTDANGQFQIIDLRPGTYTVTFTLQGFTTVARQNLELSGGGVTTVNAEMRVGAFRKAHRHRRCAGRRHPDQHQPRAVLSRRFRARAAASRGYGDCLAGRTGSSGHGLAPARAPSQHFLRGARWTQQRRQHSDRWHEHRLVGRWWRCVGLSVPCRTPRRCRSRSPADSPK